ncbi:MAG: tetratricopeptide repeat protein [Burkholderiales bacterium]
MIPSLSLRPQRSNPVFAGGISRIASAFILIAALLAGVSLVRADMRTAQDALDREDYRTALKEFLAMAEAGDGLAQSSLGVMHERGMGTPRDYGEALYWFTKSAEQGHSFGQFNLGSMYFLGQGVVQDRIEGCKWFSLALQQGNAQALYNLQMCGKYLTEAERSDYNRRVIEWQAKRK